MHAGQRIALYAALPEELDTSPLLALAWARGCEIYLPRIVDFESRRMSFVRLEECDALHKSGDSWTDNRFGIAEPKGQHTIGARWLDLVFVPLVAFDSSGMRLGMGAGFYDRAFAFRRERRAWRGPKLVGLAYSFQQTAGITPAPHDVRLDAVVTETGVLRCATG